MVSDWVEARQKLELVVVVQEVTGWALEDSAAAVPE